MLNSTCTTALSISENARSRTVHPVPLMGLRSTTCTPSSFVMPIRPRRSSPLVRRIWASLRCARRKCATVVSGRSTPGVVISSS
ncbi:Uncharacterised protein [Mycobacteroides abscessus subsp. abscessus]|nr:Uncharacterised protein [Mycobacteroides abscessus subsp. abscessus]